MTSFPSILPWVQEGPVPQLPSFFSDLRMVLNFYFYRFFMHVIWKRCGPCGKELPNYFSFISSLSSGCGMVMDLPAVRLVVPRNPTTYGGKSRFCNHMTWRESPYFSQLERLTLVAIRNCCPLCALCGSLAGCIWHPIRIFGAAHRPRPPRLGRK